MISMRTVMMLALFILFAEAAGVIGFLLGGTDFIGWYAALKKPMISPPTWVFGPAWTLLYALMGIAAFLVWRTKPNGAAAAKRRRLALICYAAQLIANFIWTPIFFRFHALGLALGEIIVLWILIIATMYTFARVRLVAMYLLIPYICWVSFASYLNAGVWWLNG